MNILNESCHLRKTLFRLPTESTRRLYYNIQWTGHFICKSDFFIKRENFESFLLLYTVSGSGTLKYRMNTYKLTADTVAIIDCRLPHEYRPDSDGWEFRYLHTEGAQTTELCKKAEELHGSPVIICETDTLRFFERIYAATESKASDERCSELIYRLLITVISAAGSKENGNEPRWIQMAYDEISEKYGSGLTVSELARAVNMSRSHFSIEFKRYVGISPQEYISSYRISAAKCFLYTTDGTVEEIASACGYRDASVFIRAFKHVEGITPAAYRKRGTPSPTPKLLSFDL